ncbi:MAG: polymer-forming cytoskeletal protein [Mangrovibacterium sp.]
MAKVNTEVQQVFTFIGQGTKFVGDMSVEGDIRIDGELEGTINCTGRLVIGLTGKVFGDIVCANFEVLGEVLGAFKVKERTTLREKARLRGELYTSVLSIEAEAIFDGTCDMSGSHLKEAKEVAKEEVVQK